MTSAAVIVSASVAYVRIAHALRPGRIRRADRAGWSGAGRAVRQPAGVEAVPLRRLGTSGGSRCSPARKPPNSTSPCGSDRPRCAWIAGHARRSGPAVRTSVIKPSSPPDRPGGRHHQPSSRACTWSATRPTRRHSAGACTRMLATRPVTTLAGRPVRRYRQGTYRCAPGQLVAGGCPDPAAGGSRGRRRGDAVPLEVTEVRDA